MNDLDIDKDKFDRIKNGELRDDLLFDNISQVRKAQSEQLDILKRIESYVANQPIHCQEALRKIFVEKKNLKYYLLGGSAVLSLILGLISLT